MSSTRAFVWLFSMGLTALATGMASGQPYPNKPIRIITTEAGSGNDLQARLLAQGISGPLGQQVIVDNRTGTISAEVVAKSPPDGYTVVLQGSTVWLAPLLRESVAWDPLRDFSPVTLTERSPNVLVVHPGVAATSIKELVALAKAKPGTLNYSSGPAGGSSHLAGELFKSLAGANIVHVPYKGGGPAILGVLGGEVQLSFGGGGSVTPHMKSGKLRALGVTGPEPSPLYPGLPAIAATVPGYEATAWTVVLAPAKTPAAIVNRLNQEMVRVLNQPEVKEKLFNAGVQVAGSTPEELAAGINSEIARWGKLIKEAGIKQVD